MVTHATHQKRVHVDCEELSYSRGLPHQAAAPPHREKPVEVIQAASEDNPRLALQLIL